MILATVALTPMHEPENYSGRIFEFEKKILVAQTLKRTLPIYTNNKGIRQGIPMLDGNAVYIAMLPLVII